MEAFIYMNKQLYMQSINQYVKDGRDCTKIITPYLKDDTEIVQKDINRKIIIFNFC